MSGGRGLARHACRGVDDSAFFGNRLTVEDSILIATAASAAAAGPGTVSMHASPIVPVSRSADVISIAVAGIVAGGRIAVKVAPVAFAARWSTPGVAIEDREYESQGTARRSIAASAAAARPAARFIAGIAARVAAGLAAWGATFVGLILKIARQHRGVVITRTVRIRPQ